MKKIMLLFIASLIFGCSSDDNCQENEDAINLKYDTQIQYVKDNPNATYGIDYRQIGLLNEERNRKLADACE